LIYFKIKEIRKIKVMEKSSGILVYRYKNGILQVLLGKCGGPYWDHVDKGAWNIPKGHVEENENLLETAKREFFEETSLVFEPEYLKNKQFLYLGESVTKSKKHVYIHALEYDFTLPFQEDVVIIKSNTCKIEWPKNSGNFILIPELSQAKYFNITEAKEYIFTYQKVFLDRLESQLLQEQR
jgi:predicted NUDIX family NTP pyrophosphohydrolase